MSLMLLTVACSETCDITHLSMSFDMKVRLEMGQKFLKISGSRRIFLISDVKIASLMISRYKVLDVRDRLIILVIMGNSSSMQCLRTHVGMGSKSHKLGN